MEFSKTNLPTENPITTAVGNSRTRAVHLAHLSAAISTTTRRDPHINTMRSFLLTSFFALLLVTNTAEAVFAGDPTPHHEIAVISNGWHTAIIVPKQVLTETGTIPELADFPDAAYIEFGWGDRTYYPSDEKSIGLAVGAILGASPAVMHVNGLQAPATEVYLKAEIVTLMMSDDQVIRLATAVSGYFQRVNGARSQPVQPGLYANSLFYHARGEFHMFNTCNTWTARMLQAAGVNISPDGVFRASTVMERLREDDTVTGKQRNER